MRAGTGFLGAGFRSGAARRKRRARSQLWQRRDSNHAFRRTGRRRARRLRYGCGDRRKGPHRRGRIRAQSEHSWPIRLCRGPLPRKRKPRPDFRQWRARCSRPSPVRATPRQVGSPSTRRAGSSCRGPCGSAETIHRCRLLQRIRLRVPRPALRICCQGGVRRSRGKPGRPGGARLVRHHHQHPQSGRATRELFQEDGLHPTARRAAPGRGQAHRRGHASLRRGVGGRLPRSLAPHFSVDPPGRFFEGFVIIQSAASLDVTAVYTTTAVDRERQADGAQQHRRGADRGTICRAMISMSPRPPRCWNFRSETG